MNVQFRFMSKSNIQPEKFQQLQVRIPEQLIFKAWLSNGEVNNGHFDAHFRQIMRIGQFSCHIKPDVKKKDNN